MGSFAALPFQNKANKQAARGYSNATDELQDSKEQALNLLDPYNKAGQTALSPLTGLLTGQQFDPATGKSTAITPEQRDALLYQSPGYRFALDQTQQSLAKSQAARGLSLSGGAQKELAQYTSGLASQYSNDYINQLFNLANSGQTAATAQANVVTGTGTQIANSLIGKGLAQAAGNAAIGGLVQSGINDSIGFGMAAGQSTGKTGNGAGGGGGLSSVNTQLASPNLSELFMAGAASDISLKENIELIGQENGFNIYHFNYKNDPSAKYRGVMAQEVIKTRPDAVVEKDGYLAVYYDKIGIEFKKIN